MTDTGFKAPDLGGSSGFGTAPKDLNTLRVSDLSRGLANNDLNFGSMGETP